MKIYLEITDEKGGKHTIRREANKESFFWVTKPIDLLIYHLEGMGKMLWKDIEKDYQTSSYPS